MKKSHLNFLALGLMAMLSLAGCSKDADGPSLSDDDLLKRGQAGHNAASGGQKLPPGTPMAPGQGNAGQDSHASK
jgi:hypothetical protein